MDPQTSDQLDNEDHEARAPSNMADAGASGEDASSASPASTDGARPRQLGAVGHPPLWLRLARTRARADKIARRTSYGRALSAMEMASDWVDGIRDVDGSWISADELLRADRSTSGERVRMKYAGRLERDRFGAPATYACGCTDTSEPSLPDTEPPWGPPNPACVACGGSGKIRDKSHYRDSDLAAARDEAAKLNAFGEPAEEPEPFGRGYLHALREATGQPNGRPPTTIGDETAIMWAFLRLLGAAIRTGSDKPELLAFQYLYSNTSVNMRALAQLSGASKSTLYNWRKWLRQAVWTKPSSSDGAERKEPMSTTPAPTIAERVSALELELQRQKELAAETARQLGLASDDERVRQAVDDFLEDTLG
jgi:transposase-like protein